MIVTDYMPCPNCGTWANQFDEEWNYCVECTKDIKAMQYEQGEWDTGGDDEI